MGKVDPTGFDAALATIQPGQLSERQQRIAAGLAMMRDGRSLMAASKATGIPRATLWNYREGVSSLGGSRQWEQETEAVHEVSYDIALNAAEAIRDSISQRPEDWKPGDLVKAYAAATDKVLAFGQRAAGAPAGIRDLFAGLLAEADLTISKRDPSKDAMDVRAVEIG